MCRKCCHTISPAAVIRWSRTWWKKTFVVILILCLFYIFFRAMCWHWTKQTQQQLLIQYAETAIKWMCCISDMSIFFRSSYNRKLYKITIAYASNGNKKEQDMTETERTSRVNFFSWFVVRYFVSIVLFEETAKTANKCTNIFVRDSTKILFTFNKNEEKERKKCLFFFLLASPKELQIVEYYRY